MKKNYLYLAALAMFTAACSNEDEFAQESIKPTPEVKMITETITASNGDNTPATRADIDANAKFAWSEGDQIAVHVSDGKYYTTSELTAGGEEADFTVEYPEGQTRNAFAVYPASIVDADAAKYGQSGATLDVTLPASYTLAQVSGTKTPCPMIATNTGKLWDFNQLCGMLRLTLDGIPADASYLQVDFDGKQVSGDFSIASPNPGSSTISTSAITSTSASNAGDKIKISALGGATSAVINLPLPTGQYSNITVSAWNSSNAKVKDFAFNYTAKRALGKRIKTSFSDESKSIITGSVITPNTSDKVDLESILSFKFQNGEAPVSKIRFVRIFSARNKLQTQYNEKTNATTYGPVTISQNTDLPEDFYVGLRFTPTADDSLVFQVIDADGKVYSGSIPAPSSGYEYGSFYNESLNVNLYTFTVTTGKKVCFSPGDLGVDNNVYSFTDPFTTWGWSGTNSTTQRVWFNYGEITSGCEICGINWRNTKSFSTNSNTYRPHEWTNIIGRTMNAGVKAYYKVTVSGHANCLLLPPDETQATDIGNDITSGIVTDYVKYLGKGFVLLISTGRATASSSGLDWGMATQGWYWALWNYMSTNRTYFLWTTDSNPDVTHAGNQFRMRARLVHDVN